MNDTASPETRTVLTRRGLFAAAAAAGLSIAAASTATGCGSSGTIDWKQHFLPPGTVISLNVENADGYLLMIVCDKPNGYLRNADGSDMLGYDMPDYACVLWPAGYLGKMGTDIAGNFMVPVWRDQIAKVVYQGYTGDPWDSKYQDLCDASYGTDRTCGDVYKTLNDEFNAALAG